MCISVGKTKLTASINADFTVVRKLSWTTGSHPTSILNKGSFSGETYESYQRERRYVALVKVSDRRISHHLIARIASPKRAYLREPMSMPWWYKHAYTPLAWPLLHFWVPLPLWKSDDRTVGFAEQSCIARLPPCPHWSLGSIRGRRLRSQMPRVSARHVSSSSLDWGGERETATVLLFLRERYSRRRHGTCLWYDDVQAIWKYVDLSLPTSSKQGRVSLNPRCTWN